MPCPCPPEKAAVAVIAKPHPVIHYRPAPIQEQHCRWSDHGHWIIPVAALGAGILIGREMRDTQHDTRVIVVHDLPPEKKPCK